MDGVGPSVEYDEPRFPARPTGTGCAYTTGSDDGSTGLWHLAGDVAWVRIDGRDQPVPRMDGSLP